MVKSDMRSTNIIIDTIENLGEQCSPRSFHDEHDKLERRFWTVTLMIMSYVYDFDKERFKSSFDVILGQYYTLFYDYLKYQQAILEELEQYSFQDIDVALNSRVFKNHMLEYDTDKKNLIQQLENIYSDLPSRAVPVIINPKLNKPYNPEWPKPEQVLNGLFDYFIKDHDLHTYYWPYKKFPKSKSNQLRETLKELLYGYTLNNIRIYFDVNKSKAAMKDVENVAEAVRMAMVELPYEHMDRAQFKNLILMIYRVNGKKPNIETLGRAINRILEEDG